MSVLDFLKKKALASPGGGWSVIRDSFPGAFQQGLPELTTAQMTQQACVYACVTLISNSIAKLPLNQIEMKDGTWQKVPTQFDLLNRPSKIANRITWTSYLVSCMLTKGAAFGLKRYESGRLRYIELLHPSTEVLVSEGGEVFYRLNSNIYSHLPETTRTVPSQYIFHVPYNPLVHPLIGVPPLEAARAAALSGSAVMTKQARTHANRPEVYGFLKVPATLTDAQAQAAKQAWRESNESNGAGITVLRNGVEFESMQVTAKEAESAAAMNLANEDMARAFGVPKHLLGIGTIPSAANAEALMLGFYSQTLQPIAELIELALDEALDLPANVSVEFDVKALSRLDTKGRYEALGAAMGSALISINEARAEEGLPPVKGGETPRVQMQDVPIDKVDEPEPEPKADEGDDEMNAQMLKMAQSLGRHEARLEATAGATAAAAADIATFKASLSTVLEDLKAQRAEIAAAQEQLAQQSKAFDEKQAALADTVEQRIATVAESTEGLKHEITKAVQSLEKKPAETPAEKPDSELVALVHSLTEKVAAMSGSMKFAGTWDETSSYSEGAAVAAKNSLWVAMRDKPGTPGERDSGWKLAIKSGKLVTPYEHR